MKIVRAALAAAVVVSVATAAHAASPGPRGTATSIATRSAATAPGTYVGVAPARLLDTRAAGGSQVAGRSSITLPVTGAHGVPAAGQVSAVVVNLTVTRPGAAGYITAYADDISQPSTSNINFVTGETRAHEVVVAPGTDGGVRLFNGSINPLDLVVDLVGYYNSGTPTAGGEFAPLPPHRVLDTRSGIGAPEAPLMEASTLAVPVAGHDGVPAEVSSVLVNLTAVQATSSGYLAMSLTDNPGTSTETSSVNFGKSAAVSNLVVAPVIDGAIRVFAGGAARSVQVVADVFGYFTAGASTVQGQSGTTAPTRLYDSRGSDTTREVPAHGSITLPVTGRGVPRTASAVAVNLTVAGPTSVGYLTAYAASTTRPTTSTVNFATTTLSNSALVPVGANGAITIYNGAARAVNLVVDLSGYVGPVAGPLNWSAPTRFPTAPSGEAGFPYGTQVDLVSCPTSTFCVALDRTTALVWHGSSWSTPVSISGGNYLGDISCASSTLCVATGQGSVVYRYDGSTWTPTTVPVQQVSSVSCPADNFCMVVGEGPGAAVFDGTAWTSVSTGLAADYQEAVSCGSASTCAVIAENLSLAAYHAGTWTHYAPFPTDPETAYGRVSCTSATYCLALARSGGGYSVAMSTFDGSSWTKGSAVSPTMLRSEISVPTCTSSTACIDIAGSGGGSNADYWPAFYDGSTWDTAAINPVQPQAASCASAGFCVIVEGDGAQTGTP